MLKKLLFASVLGICLFSFSNGQRRPEWIERDIREEKQQAERERKMSTEQRRELERERQERTSQIQRDLQERREQLQRERQQRDQQNQQREQRRPEWIERDIREEQRQSEQEIRQRQSPYNSITRPNVSGDTNARNYYGATLNEAETELYRENPRLAYKVYEIREIANEEVGRKFPNSNLRNTSADAFRHAYAAALLTRDIGAQNAKYVTDLHEMTLRNPQNEKIMDLHNNSIGIKIGSSLVFDGRGYRQPTNTELSDMTENALRNGWLIFIK